MVPPKLHQFITDFASKKVDKARDAALIRVQGSLLFAANPVANLWANLIHQGLGGDQQVVITVIEVLDVTHVSYLSFWEMQMASCLRGGGRLHYRGSSSFTEEVCEGWLHRSWNWPLCGKFEELVQKVKADGATSKDARTAWWSMKVYQSSQAQRKIWTCGYRAAFRRRYNPYQTLNSKRFWTTSGLGNLQWVNSRRRLLWN